MEANTPVISGYFPLWRPIVALTLFCGLFVLFTFVPSFVHLPSTSFFSASRSSSNVSHSLRSPPFVPDELVVVSLTTTIDRLQYLNCTLFSIFKQSVLPDEIILNVPLTSRRFKKDYPSDILSVIFPLGLPVVPCKLTIQRMKDWGPATKFIPTITRELEAKRFDTFIIIIDDDVIYPPHLIESLLRTATREGRSQAVGFRGWCAPESMSWDWDSFSRLVIAGERLEQQEESVAVDILEATSGVMVRSGFFRNHSVEIPSDAPDSAFYMDDIWMHGILSLNKVGRRVVHIDVPSQHRGEVNRKTKTLDSAPMGRGYHNTRMLQRFRSSWSKCTSRQRPPPPGYKRPVLLTCDMMYPK